MGNGAASSAARQLETTLADDGEIIRTTYGENYSRLVEVKNRYDPDNLFRLNTNIEPTGYSNSPVASLEGRPP